MEGVVNEPPMDYRRPPPERCRGMGRDIDMQSPMLCVRTGEARSASLRILIVEDEAFTRAYFRDLLSELGHRVVATAETASSAVAAAREHRPDLVLMDIRLSGEGDRIEAAVEIRDHLGIPLIFLTAHGDPDTRKRAEAAGALEYLVKPVRVWALQEALERAAKKP